MQDEPKGEARDAGLAVANGYRNNIAELSQGVRNANDGVSQL